MTWSITADVITVILWMCAENQQEVRQQRRISSAVLTCDSSPFQGGAGSFTVQGKDPDDVCSVGYELHQLDVYDISSDTHLQRVKKKRRERWVDRSGKGGGAGHCWFYSAPGEQAWFSSLLTSGKHTQCVDVWTQLMSSPDSHQDNLLESLQRTIFPRVYTQTYGLGIFFPA